MTNDPAVAVASKGIGLAITARHASDTTAPVITHVDLSPAKVAAGESVQVTVEATDNVGVTSVTADGAPLVHSTGSLWTATLTAPAQLGSHSVAIAAADAVHNSANSSASYSTVRCFGISNRSAGQPIMVSASGSFLFAVWGKVSDSAPDSFVLDDGAGRPIQVLATGHGLADGDLASARGDLDSSTNPPVLTAHVTTKLD